MPPRTTKACCAALLSLTVIAGAAFADTNPPPAGESLPEFDPTSAYQERMIEGWHVRVNRKLIADTNLCARTLSLVDEKLAAITRVVPAAPLRKLQEIPIWVERSSRQTVCACYHESREWLSTHGVNPDKTGAVEIGNAARFLSWSRDQPWMLLHELAHGYHQRFLGDDNAGILRAYHDAKASGKYDSVKRYNGKLERHYALNNPKEYFAEATEAFFGTNDYQPFTREELKTFDPEAYELLWQLWDMPGSPP